MIKIKDIFDNNLNPAFMNSDKLPEADTVWCIWNNEGKYALKNIKNNSLDLTENMTLVKMQ